MWREFRGIFSRVGGGIRWVLAEGLGGECV